jgi:hypothetical protein
MDNAIFTGSWPLLRASMAARHIDGVRRHSFLSRSKSSGLVLDL